MQQFDVRGFRVVKGFLSYEEQVVMVADIRDVVRQAPFFSPETAWGKPMSVRMSAAGKFGWYSDKSGYRYAERHPGGQEWPRIPASILAVWDAVAKSNRLPECCLINYYGKNARMGLHRDNDEADFSHPVVSISLGDAGLFRIGNLQRGGKTESIWLESGDICVMGGAARLTYHGVDRIRFGSSSLLNNGGRINLTLRVVT